MSPKIQRWSLYLSSFNIKFIKHVRATQNSVADMLSRTTDPFEYADDIFTEAELDSIIYPPIPQEQPDPTTPTCPSTSLLTVTNNPSLSTTAPLIAAPVAKPVLS